MNHFTIRIPTRKWFENHQELMAIATAVVVVVSIISFIITHQVDLFWAVRS